MRRLAGFLIVLTLGGCGHHDHKNSDRDSPAFKVGAAAHEIAKHAEKTAAAAERQLEENARKAKEGWRDKEREDREKAGRSQ